MIRPIPFRRSLFLIVGACANLTFAVNALLLGSCSTISKSSSPYSYPLPPATPDSSEAFQNLSTYRRALTLAAGDACPLWLQLAEPSFFPLAGLARIHALAVCPSANEAADPLALDLVMQKPVEPWLAEELSRAALARAIKTGERVWEMKLSIDVAKFEPVEANQISLLERAIQLAREKGDGETLSAAQTLLYRLAPRKILHPTSDQYLDVGLNYRQAREFAKAREFFEKVLASGEFSDQEKFRALDGIRMSYKLQKNSEKFLSSTQDYARFARHKFFEKPRGRPDYGSFLQAQITLARAIWTENSPSRAEAILKETERELNGRTFTGESAFVRARILEERGDFGGAVQVLDGLDVEKLARDRAFRTKIGWYRAWSYRKIGRHREAAQILEQLAVDEEKSSSLQARDLYWLGRTYRDLANQERALQIFEKLIETDPLGYYGVLAYREMNRPLPALKVASTSSNFSQDPLSAEERLKFEWLLATGEDAAANRLLALVGTSRRAGFSQDQAFEYLRLLARAGVYNALFARLGELSAEARRTLLNTEPELIFPTRWKAEIQAAGLKYHVKPELVFSIIRQESAFNPRARSHADAFGLMQLIPEMAKRAESSSGIRLNSHEDLYRPEINIPLGTSFLKTTLDTWRGAFIPTVASYNASEKAVSGWLKTRATQDPIAFIEDVPYEETKTYLKLVMRNFVFYSRLNTEQASIPFPEWCLEDLRPLKP